MCLLVHTQIKTVMCNKHCKTCRIIGECPEDIQRCADCGTEIISGEGVEVETESIDGRHRSITVTVCRECYEEYYLSANSNDLIY